MGVIQSIGLGGQGVSPYEQALRAQQEAIGMRVPRQTIRAKIESRKETLVLQLERVEKLLALLDKNAEIESLMADIEIY